jgi:hypothetical protein
MYNINKKWKKVMKQKEKLREKKETQKIFMALQEREIQKKLRTFAKEEKRERSKSGM